MSNVPNFRSNPMINFAYDRFCIRNRNKERFIHDKHDSGFFTIGTFILIDRWHSCQSLNSIRCVHQLIVSLKHRSVNISPLIGILQCTRSSSAFLIFTYGSSRFNHTTSAQFVHCVHKILHKHRTSVNQWSYKFKP